MKRSFPFQAYNFDLFNGNQDQNQMEQEIETIIYRMNTSTVYLHKNVYNVYTYKL